MLMRLPAMHLFLALNIRGRLGICKQFHLVIQKRCVFPPLSSGVEAERDAISILQPFRRQQADAESTTGHFRSRFIKQAPESSLAVVVPLASLREVEQREGEDGLLSFRKSPRRESRPEIRRDP